MGRKIAVTKYKLCEKCIRRAKCGYATANVNSCSSPNGDGYRYDKKQIEKLKKLNKREVERFLSKLKLTDRSQVRITDSFEIIYSPKSDKDRCFNSRSGTIINVEGKNKDFIKFCENCGKKFHTVTEDRRICDDCWEEICEYLGVSYKDVKSFKKGER